jgi:hydroxymethylpyrimidine pyrophosphatase-like HAD family hydrolase
VAALAQAGIPLVVATARTRLGVAALPGLAAHLAIAVCSGGAIGWSPQSADPLWRETIDVATVGAIVDHVTRGLDGAGVAAHDGDQWRMTEAYLAQRPGPRPDVVAVVPAAEIARHAACSMAICHPDLDSPDLLRVIAAAALDRPPSVTYSAGHLVDIGPTGVDKATGVARALAGLGVAPADAIAFGDMPNDLSMLALCGHPVAVANAHPDVLAAAATVTACVHRDGFSRRLRALGLVPVDTSLSDPACTCPRT